MTGRPCKNGRAGTTNRDMDIPHAITAAPAPALAGVVDRGPDYRLLLADSPQQVRAAQALRYAVFNTELNEGLSSSHASGLDRDEFDQVCDHLLVLRAGTGEVVGTYRMLTGTAAARSLGYYCAREFEFERFEPLRSQVLELGRACIAREHRSFTVLSLLWRGIAAYAQQHGARYLFGCSSLNSQDPALGMAAYRQMQRQLAPESFRTLPRPDHACPPVLVPLPDFQPPKLLSAYLSLGAWICGPPALDRAFGTIDFLTLMDLQSPEMVQRRRRFGVGL